MEQARQAYERFLRRSPARKTSSECLLTWEDLLPIAEAASANILRLDCHCGASLPLLSAHRYCTKKRAEDKDFEAPRPTGLQLPEWQREKDSDIFDAIETAILQEDENI